VLPSLPSEIVNLLLIVALVPVTIVTVRRLTHPGRWWMLAGFLGIAATGVLAILENVVPIAPVEVAKGLCAAFAGVAYAVGLWQVDRAIRGRVIR
jgi:uncharacterized membrane protein HdeD (DUF308 family)